MVRDQSSAARRDRAGEEASTKLVLESADLRTLLADLRTLLADLRTLQATSTSSVAEARWRCEKEDKWTRRRCRWRRLGAVESGYEADEDERQSFLERERESE
ncbi:hypothetical protein ACLB2K_022488 [Fragaria x ananassa]